MITKTLTDKQKSFVENFSQTGNATQSAIKAGYSAATAEQQGYNLKQQLSSEIDIETKKLLGSVVPLAIEKLTKLVNDDKISPAVRLGAINSILDRTGYQTVHKVEDVTKQRTDEELETELQHLIKGLGSSDKDTQH